MRILAMVLIFVAGCTGALAPGAGDPVPTSIPPGVYRGDTTCETTTRVNLEAPTISEPIVVAEIVEVIDGGVIVERGEPIHVGQRDVTSLSDFEIASVVSRVAATANGIIVTGAVSIEADNVDGDGDYVSMLEVNGDGSLTFARIDTLNLARGNVGAVVQQECIGVLIP